MNQFDNIINSFYQKGKNIVVDAVAGSGKTTLLLRLIAETKERFLVLAFNKAIQLELSDRMAVDDNLSNGKALTMHSLGFSSVKKFYSSSVSINNNYAFDLIFDLKKKHTSYFKMPWKEQLKIIYSLIDLHEISRIYYTNDLFELKKHASEMGKSITLSDSLAPLWEIFLAKRLEHYEKKEPLQIDYTDMIYLPILKNLRIHISPVYLGIDEVQDLNKLQHIFIQKLIAQGDVKQVIYVGDPNQSIYGFTGAFPDSLEQLKKEVNTEVLPLSTCFRCPINIINKTNEVYNIMVPKEDAEEGEINITESVDEILDNSLLICRNSKPLLDIYFELLSNNRKAYLYDTSILDNTVRFLKPYKNKTVTLGLAEMRIDLEDKRKNLPEQDRFQIGIFENNMDSFIVFWNHFKLSNINDIVAAISNLKNEEKTGIKLCTIHSSKGLEADHVYILNESLIPSKYAKSKNQLTQEKNLKYVARSRAKKTLTFLNYNL